MTDLLRWGFDLLRHLLRTVDWLLLGALLALMAIGLAVYFLYGRHHSKLAPLKPDTWNIE